MSCLDDETLDALVGGRLSGPELIRADAHLDGCAECRAMIVALTASERGGGTLSEASSAGPGARLGRFITLEPVGAGAMGVVYAAYDPKLDRRVALKLMRTDTDQDPARARERLLREARAMAQLAHPNVIAVYDVGTVGEAVFVAMELVEGQDLRRWCAAARRSWRELRDVYVQAAQGLAAAHAVGLVHRDFKPDNVIVGAHGRAQVGDFGLARAAPGPATADDGASLDAVPPTMTSTITGSGTLAGTPAYMAPEVLAGQPADARSDQCSLCIAFYEAVAGTHPYPASTMGELVMRIGAGRIEPPADRSVPGWLLEVLTRGMSRRPQERFANMDALLVALRRDQRLGTRVGAGVGSLVLVGATSGAFWLGQETHPAPAPCEQAPTVLAEVWNEASRAEVAAAFASASPSYGEATASTVQHAIDRWGTAWVEAHRSTCEATHVRGEQSESLLDLRMRCLRGQLQQLDALTDRLVEPVPGVVEHAVDAVALLPSIERCADVEALAAVMPPADAETAAAVAERRSALAELGSLVATAQFTRAEAGAQAEVEAALELGYAPLVADARLLAAHVARGLGRLDQARDAGYEALWAAERSHDDETVARAWLSLQGIAGEHGRWEEAAHLGRHAEAAISRLGMPAALEATLRNGLGIVHEQRGEHARARVELERALQLRIERFGESHPEVARVHTNLGNLARSEGRPAEALALHRRALAIDTAALGEGHPALGRHHHNVARLLLLAGAPQDARAHYEQALAIRVAAHGTLHPDVARTHNSLGLLYASQDQAERAREHYAVALRTFEALDHAERELVRHNLEQLEAPAAAPAQPPAADGPTAAPRPAKARPRTTPPAPEPEPPAGAYAPGRAWDGP